MSELIFRNQVADIGEIDYTNPLSEHFRFGLLPNQGSGNDLTILGVNDTRTLPSNLTWNGDGSITSSGTTYANSVIVDGEPLNDYDDITTSTHEFILFAHIRRDSSSTGNTKPIIDCRMGGKDVINISESSYAKQLIVQVSEGYTGNTYEIGTEGVYDEYIVILYVTQSGFDVYVNGTLEHSHTFTTGFSGASSYQNRLSSGTSSSSFFGSYCLASSDGFTTEQVESLAQNPYQVFKTQEDVQSGYGLFWDNTAGQGVKIPVTGSTTGLTVDATLSRDIQDTLTGQNSSRKFLSWDGARNIAVNLLTGNFAIGSGVTQVLLNGVDVTLDLSPLTNAIEGDKITAVFSADNNQMLVIGTAVSGNDIGTSGSCGNLGVATVEVTDDDGYHLFSFNHTQGDVVQSETSSLQATLVNFPADSGYVRGDNGEIVGYEFANSVSATLSLTGAYSGTLTYSDDSTLAISGSGDYVVNSGIVKNVTVTDTLVSYNYDFTTGDGSKIPETLTGNNATIVNASTVKWQPVVEKFITYLGAESYWDYQDLYTALDSEAVQSGHRKIILKSDITQTATDNCNKSGYDILELTSDEVFDGSQSSVPTIRHTAGGTGALDIRQGGTQLLIHDIAIDADGGISNGAINVNSYTGKAEIYSCFIKSDKTCIFGGDLVRNNVLIGDYRTVYATNEVLNNIIVSNGTGSPDERCLQEVDYAQDNIMANSTGSNYDHDLTESVNNQEMLISELDAWLADLDNGDVRINQTGQTALQGQGWNGSDIASWAYAPIDTGGDDYLITPILSGGGSISSSYLTSKDIGSITLSGGGELSISPVIGRLIQSAISGNGDIDTLVQIVKTITSILSERPNIATAMGVSKYAVSQLSTEGNFATSTEFAKIVATIISGGGTISSDVVASTDVVSGIVSALNGGGNILTQITTNRSVDLDESMSINSFNALRTYIQSGKFAVSNITAQCTFNTNIAKSIQQNLNITTQATLSSDVFIDKSVISEVSTETHIAINTEKGVSYISNISGDADIITSIEIDRTTGALVLTAGGTISTVLLKDFEDSNIHYITMSTTATETTYIISSISEEIYKEIEINAGT